MNKYLLLFFTIYHLSLFAQHSKEHLNDFSVITDMMDSVKKMKYARFKLKSLERIETGFSIASTRIKLQSSPRKCYLINPEKKLEVLYNEGQLNNKCLVKPHVFPYFTMALDPKGNLMRKNQHFTIHEIGFEFAVKTIVMALSKEKDKINKHLTVVGKAQKNNMNCYLVVYENVAFSYFDYTVQPKETVSSIAYKFIVNDYMLRCKNNLYNDYDYLKAGSKIKVPNYYCKKAVFYIDDKTMLPISLSIYDEVGLFESYDYFDVEINKPIPPAEFDKHFKGYTF